MAALATRGAPADSRERRSGPSNALSSVGVASAGASFDFRHPGQRELKSRAKLGMASRQPVVIRSRQNAQIEDRSGGFLCR